MELKSPSAFVAVFGCLLVGGIFEIGAIAGSEDEFSPSERSALAEFRRMLGSEPLFTARAAGDFMKSDDYLIHWLRATNEFKINWRRNYPAYRVLITNGPDLGKAFKKLQTSLQWRKDNRIDQILSEDFGDLERAYPFDLSRVDKHGRLVAVAKYSDWNLREGTEGPDPARLARYVDYIKEKAAQAARAVHNSSQYSWFFDAKDFNEEDHSCARCREVYPYFYGSLDTNYPQQAKYLFHVNAPKAFEDVNTNLIGAHLSTQAKRSLKTYGGESEWLAEVGALIGNHAIPDEFRHESFRPTTTTTPPPPLPSTTTTSKPPAGPFVWHNSCGGCSVGR